MAKRRKGGGGGGQGLPTGYPEVIQGVNDWNNQFHGSYSGAEDYAQNNPWSQASGDWINSTLSGSMQNNPWASRLYDQTQGLDMNQGLAYLNDYLSPQGSGGGSGSGRPGYRPAPRGYGGGGGGYSSSGHSSSGGGTIPDSTVGDKFFSQHVNELFDPSRLDPANDPTMQPMIDAIKRESEEAYLRSITDIANQAEGAGRYGGGLYQGMRAQQQDEYSEALQSTIAGQYKSARDAALQRQMEALGLVNTRDISAGQIAAQLEAANMSAGASSANARLGYDAEMDSHRLQAMQMMLGAGQFGMQMGGQMADMTQNGQIAANQLAQGWAQIGQHGYDQSANFGQLGMGAMNQLGGLYGNAAQLNNEQARLAEQRRQWDAGQQSRDMNDMINMITGLSNLGGYNDQPGYVPSSAGPSPQGYNWGDIMGSILGGFGTYAGMK